MVEVACKRMDGRKRRNEAEKTERQTVESLRGETFVGKGVEKKARQHQRAHIALANASRTSRAITRASVSERGVLLQKLHGELEAEELQTRGASVVVESKTIPLAHRRGGSRHPGGEATDQVSEESGKSTTATHALRSAKQQRIRQHTLVQGSVERDVQAGVRPAVNALRPSCRYMLRNVSTI